MSRYGDLTLVASHGAVANRDKQYVDRFMKGTADWYHIPASTTDKRISRTVMRELSCCAIAVHPAGSSERVIEHLYDVISVQLLKRCELTVEQAGSVDPDNQNEYWLLRLGPSRTLPQPVSTGSIRSFRFRLTASADLLAAKRWSDLTDRYASFV